MRKNTDQKNSEYGHFSRSIKTKTIDLNKAHGHNTISIRMLRICNESICKPLGIIFRSCSQNGKFPSEWKKANVAPAFKKKQQTRTKELSVHFFTACFKQNI